MTQVTTKELAAVVCPKAQQGTIMSSAVAAVDGLVLGVLLAGFVLECGWRAARREDA